MLTCLIMKHTRNISLSIIVTMIVMHFMKHIRGVAVQAWEGIKLAKISYDGDKEFKPKNGPTWNLIGKKLVG